MMQEAVEQRVSVRTYEKRPLDEEEEKAIKNMLRAHERYRGPFSHDFSFFFLENHGLFGPHAKVGTYGFIKNAPAFIGGTCEDTFEALVDFGFVFEHIILEATRKGFGTVWLGGSFKREAFKAFKDEGTFIPAVSPIGTPAGKASLRERIIRRAAKARKRKPFSELFFLEDFNRSLPHSHAFSEALEWVRAAPSAHNKQPWRILITGNHVRFYVNRDDKLRFSYDMQALDIGIAIAHFTLAMRHFGREVTFLSESVGSSPFEYVLSARVD